MATVGGRDVWGAVVATVAMLAQVRLGADPEPSAAAAGTAPLLVAAGVALVWRRTRPVPVVAVVTAVAVVQQLLVGSVLPVAGWCAIIVAARHLRRSALLAAGAVALAVMAGAVAGGLIAGTLDNLTIVALLTAVVTLAAGLWRANVDRVEGQRRQRAAERREAAVAERLRIARDLHDLVGHGLSTIAVQSSTARMALDAGDAGSARMAMAAVETASRGALAEMREMLGVLRLGADQAPTPGLAALDPLVAAARAAGQRITVDSAVTADVPAAAGLCAYRVVQEALTNAAKHAAGAAVAVTVRTDGDTLLVRVDDDAEPGAAADDDRPRYGLTGLRERVTAAGGTFAAGRRPDAPGWRVTARLPLREEGAS